MRKFEEKKEKEEHEIKELTNNFKAFNQSIEALFEEENKRFTKGKDDHRHTGFMICEGVVYKANPSQPDGSERIDPPLELLKDVDQAFDLLFEKLEKYSYHCDETEKYQLLGKQIKVLLDSVNSRGPGRGFYFDFSYPEYKELYRTINRKFDKLTDHDVMDCYYKMILASHKHKSCNRLK